MIPGNARENSNMREKKMKLGPLFQDACRIFVTLANDKRSAGDIDRLRESLQPGPNQIIKVESRMAQHGHDHSGRRGLAMTSSHNHPLLVPAFLEDIFWK